MSGLFKEMKSRGRSLFRRFGIEVARYPLRDCLRYTSPTTILDVGANVGNYGLEVRRLGYREQIHSFEPYPIAFASLEKLAAQSRPSDRWRCHNFGLGECDRDALLNVSEESVFNSIKKPLSQSGNLNSGIISKESVLVKVRSLDGVWKDLNLSNERVFLKIDTQGYELPVLRGAGAALNEVVAIQVEISLTPLYEEQPAIEEVVPFLRQHGFSIYGIWPGFRESNQNRLIEADFLFTRN